MAGKLRAFNLNAALLINLSIAKYCNILQDKYQYIAYDNCSK